MPIPTQKEPEYRQNVPAHEPDPDRDRIQLDYLHPWQVLFKGLPLCCRFQHRFRYLTNNSGSDINTVYNQMVKYTPKPPSIEIL